MSAKLATSSLTTEPPPPLPRHSISTATSAAATLRLLVLSPILSFRIPPSGHPAKNSSPETSPASPSARSTSLSRRQPTAPISQQTPRSSRLFRPPPTVCPISSNSQSRPSIKTPRKSSAVRRIGLLPTDRRIPISSPPSSKPSPRAFALTSLRGLDKINRMNKMEDSEEVSTGFTG